VLIGDVRKKNGLLPLGIQVLAVFQRRGFKLESIVIKTQHKDRSTEFYLSKDTTNLLMAHEYLFILRR
jgi:hypothetical protein